MRTFYALLACSMAYGALVGCGDDTSSGSGAGGAGGSNNGGTTSNNMGGTTSQNMGGTTSNNMGGMAPNCDGVTGNTTDCALCAEGSCCPELDACLNDANCSACLSGMGTACDMDALAVAFDDCLTNSCATECAPVNACNPVTNEGCDTAGGQACDFGQGGLTCYDPPNDVVLCGACDPANGPFCQAGSTCALNNQCTKFCCTDADCGTGKCDTSQTGDTFGVCTLMNDSTMPSCDAPAMPPSMGTCFTL